MALSTTLSPTAASNSLLAETQPVAVHRRLVISRDGLDRAEREVLLDALQGLYRETGEPMSDPEQFAIAVLPDASARLCMFVGADGRLAGFAHARVRLEVARGQRWHVITTGIHVRPGYDGFAAASQFHTEFALRTRIRSPLIPVAMQRQTDPIDEWSPRPFGQLLNAWWRGLRLG